MQPLVTVGVPTYNRPGGLRSVLLGITKQTYQNLQIIVADNCSEIEEVKIIAEEFSSVDPRIAYFRHNQNNGATFNFQFVLDKALGNYFLWAADDDEWQQTNFISSLVEYAPSNILTFPDAILKSSNDTYIYPLRIYENCVTKVDYLKAFCSTGHGYPFYGLFNLKLFYDSKMSFEFDNDLAYYGEGTFLHKLFLTGSVKYVKNAQILFSTNSSKPSFDIQIDSFLKYFKRTIGIYLNSDLPSQTKSDLINTIFDNYSVHLKDLFLNYKAEKIPGRTRVKKAIKVLLKGKI